VAPAGYNTAANAGLPAGHARDCPSEAGISSGRQGAFTLIEVLVSMVILATGIVLVLRAFETSVVALAEARDALRATCLLESKLAGIRAEAAAGGGAGSASSGFFDEPYREYAWTLESKSAGIIKADRQGTNKLEEVSVTVRRSGSSAAYGATTYVRTGS
jgi:prepilin-type N-terminal cleavage/methylation domain-containing protein